jgi:hypothetical protein
MKNYIVYKSSVSIIIDNKEIGTKDVFVEIVINKSDDYEIDGKWGLYYDKECRRYIDFEDIPMNKCDVADKIKEALIEKYNCIDDVNVFDENGHEFTGIGTARGDFLAYQY